MVSPLSLVKVFASCFKETSLEFLSLITSEFSVVDDSLLQEIKKANIAKIIQLFFILI
jgi:hypothetical protein